MIESSFQSLHAQGASLAQHGQKAALLARAVTLGERVPAGFVIDVRQALALAQGSSELEHALAQALAWLSESSGVSRVAVRSSPTLSLPGALSTELSVPCEPAEVLRALRAVLASTGSPSVIEQARATKLALPTAPWCAVLVQAFVEASDVEAAGVVLCTRHPTSGKAVPSGEYVPRAGADQVVSGRVTPRPLALADARRDSEHEALETVNHALFSELCALGARLDQAFDEPLELEIVHAEDVTWLLQVRPLALSPRALAQVALDAIANDSGRYAHWLTRVIDEALPALVEARMPPPEQVGTARMLAKGLAASPGSGTGILVIDLDEALERAQKEPVVLARRDAVPEDVAAFRAAKAVVTTSGGLTSHAAVIARGLRVPAVVGVGRVHVDLKQRCLVDAHERSRVLAREGDIVSVDGHRGLVYSGQVDLLPAVQAEELTQLLAEVRKLRRWPLWVRASLDVAGPMRKAFQLDGVLAPCPAETSVQPDGKDVWLEVPAAQALTVLPSLPSSYGVVLCGPLDDALLTEVRRTSRLRALGVRACDAADLRSPEPLDLLLAEAGDDVSKIAVQAAKIAFIVDSAADFSQFGHRAMGAVACEPPQVLRFALGLASLGREGP
jgi:phosphoenolpyruvate synthase/pyruvate phosphate dikinase